MRSLAPEKLKMLPTKKPKEVHCNCAIRQKGPQYVVNKGMEKNETLLLDAATLRKFHYVIPSCPHHCRSTKAHPDSCVPPQQNKMESINISYSTAIEFSIGPDQCETGRVGDMFKFSALAKLDPRLVGSRLRHR